MCCIYENDKLKWFSIISIIVINNRIEISFLSKDEGNFVYELIDFF